MRTIPELFETSVKKYGDNPFLWEKKTKEYASLSYKQTRDKIYNLAAGLHQSGLKKGERVALLSEGRNDWVISEMAILYTGAVNVPLSVKLEKQDILFRINHAECRFIFVSANQYKKIRDVKDQFTTVEKIILLDDMDDLSENEVFVMELSEKGKQFLSDEPGFISGCREEIQENDYANICYTSGTTADPKGIILSHLNYFANVEQAISLMNIPPHYKTLLILPLDHSFAHTAGIYTFMKLGASIATVQIGKTANETIRNIPVNIKEVKPHILMSVPALARNFKNNIEKGIREKGPKVERMFKKALATAIDYNGIGWDKGKGLKKLKKPLLWLYDKILFSKIRMGFGGNLQYFIGGGALLDLDLQKFFYAIGMPMYQGYGLSEAAPIISSNAAHRHKMGSSGFLVKDLELKICDEDGAELPLGEKGEIVVKGENVMAGYWKNETATKEALRDGWLYTGDMGYMDQDGFLYVLGRFKSLLIGHDGEKYSPEAIEEMLMEKSQFIHQIMLHNNQDPYTVALIYPAVEAIKSYCKKNQIEKNKCAETGIELIQKEIDRFKAGGEFEKHFPERWLPASFAIIEEGFTEGNRMMNSTLKIVRGKITEAHQDKLSEIYTPEGKNIFNQANVNRLADLLK